MLPLLMGAGYTLLLLAPLIRRGQREQQAKLFIGFLAISVVWTLLLVIAPGAGLPRTVTDRVLLSGTVVLGLTTAVHADWPHQRRWIILGTAVILAGLAVDILAPNWIIVFTANAERGIRNSYLITYLSWASLNGIILHHIITSYRSTRFPWHANRQLFWLLATLTIFLGELILFLGDIWPSYLPAIGHSIRLFGAFGLTYAVISHRIFDVRTRAQRLLTTLLITIISALPILGAVLLVEYLTQQQSFVSAAVLTIVVLTVGIFFYNPFRRLITNIVQHTLLGESLNTGQALRSYSQAISRTLDVQQLSLVISGMLNELLGTSRGALMLVTDVEDGYQIEPIPAFGYVPKHPVTFSQDSRFVRQMQQHQPLLQYEMDFNSDYADLTAAEREWLAETAMEIYVPVSTSDTLSGLIAVGPKSSGIPYQPGELELMQTLADQTVIALQNARLYSELGTQNDKIRFLNVDLVEQNERLEIMDRVKTDFITIASHELRTPLTQVKGYSDILAAMNDENALTREQTKEIVGHINRATLRLEGLITAMLDASQLDVDGMQLTFMETKLETVLRLAMEPLVQAVRERRISVMHDGVSEMPPFYADFKRLVQCLSNLIGNAVKYTPDNGRISINAMLIPDQDGEANHVEIVITDTGIGIDPKYHDLIFEKFFRIGDPQLHSTGSTKFKGAGPGLGLPIAKGVIEAHGGKIWVESEGEDEERLPGSSFHIVLPMRPPTMTLETSSNGTTETEERPAYLIG